MIICDPNVGLVSCVYNVPYFVPRNTVTSIHVFRVSLSEPQLALSIRLSSVDLDIDDDVIWLSIAHTEIYTLWLQSV